MGEAEKLLYRCLRELAYVQEVENCGSGLCATAAGKLLIQEGVDLLKLKDLSADPKEWQ